jgi:hypothetical protein
MVIVCEVRARNDSEEDICEEWAGRSRTTVRHPESSLDGESSRVRQRKRLERFIVKCDVMGWLELDARDVDAPCDATKVVLASVN